MTSTLGIYHRQKTRLLFPRDGPCVQCYDLSMGQEGRAIFEGPVATPSLNNYLSNSRRQTREDGRFSSSMPLPIASFTSDESKIRNAKMGIKIVGHRQ
jgi:hypothetical protein